MITDQDQDQDRSVKNPSSRAYLKSSADINAGVSVLASANPALDSYDGVTPDPNQIYSPHANILSS